MAALTSEVIGWPQSKAPLEALHKAFGLIPSLAATMAESPTLLGGFVGAIGNFMGGTFSGVR